MTELTESQLEILEKPFQGVTPEIRNGMWRAYKRLWTMENGVPVRATKRTISTLRVQYNGTGEDRTTELVDERAEGYSLEFAQKVGKLTLGQTDNWRVLSFDGPVHLQKHKTSHRFFVHEGEKPSDADENENLIEFLDSHQCAQEPILIPQEEIIMPQIETEEQLIEIFETYNPEKQDE